MTIDFPIFSFPMCFNRHQGKVASKLLKLQVLLKGANSNVTVGNLVKEIETDLVASYADMTQYVFIYFLFFS